MTLKQLLLHATLELQDLNKNGGFDAELKELDAYIQSGSPYLKAHLSCIYDAMLRYDMARGCIPNFYHLTIKDVLFILKTLFPKMEEPIENILAELTYRDEVLDNSFDEVLNDCDYTVMQDHEPLRHISLLATTFYDELLSAIKAKYPDLEELILISDMSVYFYPKQKMEPFIVYNIEDRVAQFSTFSHDQRVNVFYTYQCNHKTDGIQITKVVALT